MRIAIVCSYYPWPPSVGGVETIAKNIAIELAKRGHEVHIITTPFDVTTMKQVSDYGVEERDSVVIHKLKPERIRVGYARVLKDLRKVVERIKPEILHSHNLHPHLFQLAKWKKDLGYKLVAELHYPAIELDFLIQKTLLWFTMKLLKMASRHIDVFIAHTQLEKTWLEQYGIEQYKIKVLFTPHINSSLLVYKSSSPRNNHRVLFLGRVVPRKGVHILINAFYNVKTRISEAELVIAGPEDPKYKEKLLGLIKKLSITNDVKLVGSVDEEEKIRLMATARVFCLPTLADYHPIVLLEAQALGTPVVTTNISAIPEIVINKKTGILVEPANINEITKAIITLLTDEKLWKEMSANAREFAKQFTLEKRVDELESLYGDALKW